MSTSDADLSAIQDAAKTNAERGVMDMSIGDRRAQYSDPLKLLQAKRALDNEDQGGVYTVVPQQKGYF
jgi:hypothetical protein